MLHKTLYPGIACLAALLSACLGAPDPYPERPVADAGTDTFGTVGERVVLDGSASSSPRENQTLTYDWTFESLPSSSTLDDEAFDPDASPTAVTTSFVPDRPGRYVVRLSVSDNVAESLDDFVVVDVSGGAATPTADAGPDQVVQEGMAVYFDGTGSTDPNGATLYYRWTLEGTPALSHLTTEDLSNRYTPYPSLIVDSGGLFTLSLVVSNGNDMSPPDYVFVTVQSTNSPPVADAGEDRTVHTGSEVLLDGSGSYDADGDPLTQTWTLLIVPLGSTLPTEVLPDSSQGATFTPDIPGLYVVELVVSDGETSSVPDVVTITAVPPA